MRLTIPSHVLRMSDQEFQAWTAAEHKNARRDAQRIALSVVVVGFVLLLVAVFACPHLH